MEERKNLLEIKDLKVSFFTPAGEVKAVNGISYTLGYDEVMGIVGESGSGKSVSMLSVMGLLPDYAEIVADLEARAACVEKTNDENADNTTKTEAEYEVQA